MNEETIHRLAERIRAGREAKYHARNAAVGKRFVRDRLRLLLDDDPAFEDGLFANALADGFPADGVVTVIGRILGRPVAVVANDSTVKAGSWGARTVEKIIRTQEVAEKLRIPLVYLVDSAGARITDQVEMFPGRRGAGRIFHNQVRLSGAVPQVCVLFGPSAAGGAYIPAFCDIVIMVDKNASMYLGSPRMAETVIGERVTLEEMGGARMHCTVSGCGDVLAQSEEEAIEAARAYLSYMPQNADELPPSGHPREARGFDRTLKAVLPANQNAPFDMFEVIHRLIDDGTWYEIKGLFAPEIITGFGRLEGRVVGIVANQPLVKGGVLFVDSADKAARFITLCDAFSIPLVFLADVPGFMIGTQVERAGIIRHGAKMIAAMSEATVPKLSVIVRKAYGAGLYAMAGPAFEPDCCLAFPNAQIAVMGPEAAVNAVYSNRLQAMPESERKAFVEGMRAQYRQDIDVVRLASELVVDGIVDPDCLRGELSSRLAVCASKQVAFSRRKHPVHPV